MDTSSAVESFFDITTGRNHGVVPTADALRVILDSGATLLMRKVDGGFRATAAWPPAAAGDELEVHPGVTVAASSVEAAGERIDKALSALVGRLVLGASGVEVTEWAVPPIGEAYLGEAYPFGQVRVPLVAVDPASAEGDIARMLVGVVEAARRERGRGGRIDAVVVRVSGRGDVAGVACLPGRPEPPVGATLTGRRLVGGTPRADVPWQAGSGRLALVQRAMEALRRDCALAGIDSPGPRLLALDLEGREMAAVDTGLPWGAQNHPALPKAIESLEAAAARCRNRPVTLRVAAAPEAPRVDGPH